MSVFRTLYLLQSHCTKGLRFPKQSVRRLIGSRLLPDFYTQHHNLGTHKQNDATEHCRPHIRLLLRICQCIAALFFASTKVVHRPRIKFPEQLKLGTYSKNFSWKNNFLARCLLLYSNDPDQNNPVGLWWQKIRHQPLF